MIILNLLIAIPWTILIIALLYSEYKSTKQNGWYKYPDVVLGLISHLMIQFTFGFAIWMNVFIQLTTYELIKLIILGVLFMILSTVYRSIHNKRLKEEFYRHYDKVMKKIEEMKKSNGSNSNNKI